jgi:hypothetical protein
MGKALDGFQAIVSVGSDVRFGEVVDVLHDFSASPPFLQLTTKIKERL